MGTGLIFSIFRRLFSLPDGYVESGKSLEELTLIYRRWERYSLTMVFVFTPPVNAG